MLTKRIFISCGVHTQQERASGQKLRQLVEEQKMTSFLAPEVHQPADLNTKIAPYRYAAIRIEKQWWDLVHDELRNRARLK